MCWDACEESTCGMYGKDGVDCDVLLTSLFPDSTVSNMRQTDGGGWTDVPPPPPSPVQEVEIEIDRPDGCADDLEGSCSTITSLDSEPPAPPFSHIPSVWIWLAPHG